MKWIYYLAILILPAMISCEKPVMKLNGKWAATVETGDTVKPHGWYLEYRIDGDEYIKNGFPPYLEQGKFEITQHKGDTIEVLFIPEKRADAVSAYTKTIYISSQEKLIMDGEEFLKIDTK